MKTSTRTLPGRKREERRALLSQAMTQQRADALERLIALLEGGNSPFRQRRIPTGESEANQMSRVARLRAAHAAYALTSGVVPQMGTGAWLRSR
jgi:hypothetical protein